jgi:hypothetical protein
MPRESQAALLRVDVKEMKGQPSHLMNFCNSLLLEVIYGT